MLLEMVCQSIVSGKMAKGSAIAIVALLYMVMRSMLALKFNYNIDTSGLTINSIVVSFEMT